MEPGTRIRDYEMVRQLGVGGMAEVWLARNAKMRGQYAVKFILDQFAGNRDIQERFVDEALRQSGLDHPNIVDIKTVFNERGRDFIIMEYVESGLDKRLRERNGRPLPVPEAVNVTLQLLSALEYTHTLPEGELIHRDIKPPNILLKADGSVRLTDFGIALAANEARKTVMLQVVGTAFYMSPEQIQSPATVGRRTDIYSTGCVLYEMLTGRPPFGKEGDTDYSIQYEHINRDPDPLRKSNTSIPEHYEWIVQKALAKSPGARFQSCREMASALLNAYRQAGLPMEQLSSYHGGLTAPPIYPNADIPSGYQPVPVQPPVAPPPMRPPVAPPHVSRRWYSRPAAYLPLLLLLLVGCGVLLWPHLPLSRGTVILRLEGSTSVGDELAPALAQAYLSERLSAKDVRTDSVPGKDKDGTPFTTFTVHGDVGGKRESIEIVSNGSGKAFKALEGNTADLGMSSRPFSGSAPTDLSYLTSSNQYEHVIALDGIAVIVNLSNRSLGLTMDQLKGIFTGGITDWSQLGGASGPIHCYGRKSDSGTGEMFRNSVVTSKGKLSAIRAEDEFSDGKQVVDHVADDPNGIGYVTFTQAKGVNVVALSDRGTQPLNPSPLTVSTEDYILTRRLFLYEPIHSSSAAKDFVRFILEKNTGQNVVSNKDFVPVVPVCRAVPASSFEPVEYRKAVDGLRRCGLSFRFTSGKGSVQGNNYLLDNLARDNIKRLSDYVRANPELEVVLLGFTDSQPGRVPNTVLAHDRATSVAEALSTNGITPTHIYGLGAVMPVATNDTDAGKAKNRRVEVWVTGNGT